MIVLTLGEFDLLVDSHFVLASARVDNDAAGGVGLDDSCTHNWTCHFKDYDRPSLVTYMLCFAYLMLCTLELDY